MEAWMKWLIGIVGSLVVAGVVASFSFVMSARSEIDVLKVELSHIHADKAADEAQDAQLRRQWRYLSWLRQNTLKLFQMGGHPLPDEPDLGD